MYFQSGVLISAKVHVSVSGTIMIRHLSVSVLGCALLELFVMVQLPCRSFTKRIPLVRTDVATRLTAINMRVGLPKPTSPQQWQCLLFPLQRKLSSLVPTASSLPTLSASSLRGAIVLEELSVGEHTLVILDLSTDAELVRSPNTRLREVFGKFGENAEFVVLPDLTVDGAYDKHLDGVCYIIHVATPTNLEVRALRLWS